MSGSLHENVTTWCDTCGCEPEPRWQAVAAEAAQRKETDREQESNAATMKHDGPDQR